MRNRPTCVLLAVALALAFAVGAQARQTSADDAKIERLKAEIKLLLDDRPPAGAATQEAARLAALRSLRGDLRDQLLEKRGALKSRLSALQSQPNPSDALRSYAKVLEAELQGLNGEVEGLKEEAARAGADDTPPAPEPATAARMAPAVRSATDGARGAAAAQADNPTAFDAAVKALSSEMLAAAVAPAEVTTSALPEFRCTSAGMTRVTRPGAGGDDSDTGPSKYDSTICTLSRKILDQFRINKQLVLEQDSESLYTILSVKLLKAAGDESYASFVTQAQERRTDQQLGAGPSSNGTTSLVSKGGIPYLLSFAVENGAATQTQSDTTVTFRLNPAGVLGFFNNSGFITGFRQTEDDALLKSLRKTSVGLTFDTTRGDTPGVFTGDRQQLSELSVRVEFVNDRDPRLRKHKAAWERFVATHGVDFANEIEKTTLATITFGDRDGRDKFKDPALQAWLEQTNARISAETASLAGDERVAAVYKIIGEQADRLPVGLVSEQTVTAVTGFAKGFKSYLEAKNQLLDDIATGNVLTFDYTNRREVNAPDTSNFRFIAARGREVMGGRMDFTANGSLTLFHKTPAPLTPGGPRPGRVRDFQFAGQVDVPFKVGDVGQFVFWFSGRYERLLENATDPAGASVPGTKGDIAIGQFGLKVPIPGIGMQLPLSFTFANRTELVKEKEVRGNFGFTLNFDSIMSRFKPF